MFELWRKTVETSTIITSENSDSNQCQEGHGDEKAVEWISRGEVLATEHDKVTGRL